MLVYPVSNRSERFAVGSLLYVSGGSKPIELCIESASRHKNGFLVKFVGCDDMSAAEKFRGSLLTGPPLESGEGDLFVHELIGKTLTDQSGFSHGKVVSVEANPASDLLVLENSGLVPLVFVRSVTETEILVDIPEGLLS